MSIFVAPKEASDCISPDLRALLFGDSKVNNERKGDKKKKKSCFVCCKSLAYMTLVILLSDTSSRLTKLTSKSNFQSLTLSHQSTFVNFFLGLFSIPN